MVNTMSIKQFLAKPETENQKMARIEESLDFWFTKAVKTVIYIIAVSLGLELMATIVLPVVIHTFIDVMQSINTGFMPLK